MAGKIFKLSLCFFLPVLIFAAAAGEVSAAVRAPIKKQVKSTKDIKTLAAALKAGVPVVVKLGSDRCPPCRAMEPIIKELSVEEDGKVVLLSLDVYEHRDLAKDAGVRVIPTILFYDKQGKPKVKKEGFMNKEQLLKAIKELNK